MDSLPKRPLKSLIAFLDVEFPDIRPLTQRAIFEFVYRPRFPQPGYNYSTCAHDMMAFECEDCANDQTWIKF